MTRAIALAAALALAATIAAHGRAVTHTYGAPDAPIATSVDVPPGMELLYVSGLPAAPLTPPAPGAAPSYGDTEQQTDSALGRIEAALKARGFGPGDVVKMNVFLAGDPAKGGAMDFAGMMAAYKRHYGTPDQPNRPARTTVQVASLVGAGQLVEIEVVAAKKPSP